MAMHSLKAIQHIPVSRQEAWTFFSNPANLQIITPDDMGFRIISRHHGEKMYPGQIIEYKIRPLLNIPFYWMTEITHVQDAVLFVDEQRKGPYSMWHHQHHFEDAAGGVLMTDIVHYKNPFGFFGNMANELFVKKQLRRIFLYRAAKVEELFGRGQNGQQFLMEMH